jgi:hypothetical protein
MMQRFGPGRPPEQNITEYNIPADWEGLILTK